MKTNQVSAVLFFFAALSQANVATADKLEDFLRVKLANYTTWLKVNNLDPAPLIPGPNEFSEESNITSLDVTLRNHGMEGHSGHLIIDKLIGYVSGQILFFEVDFHINENVTFYGDYQANGTILGENVIAAEGSWRIQVGKVYCLTFQLVFQETPSGNYSLDGWYLTLPALDGSVTREVDFENLLENESAIGHEEDIKSVLFQGFQSYLVEDFEEHPIRALYMKYWQEIFDETTFGDITSNTS